MFKLNIRNKILFAFILLAAIPIFITSLVIDWRAGTSAESAIEEQVKSRLLSLREVKKAQVESYFKNLSRQMKSYSVDPAIIFRASDFNKAVEVAAHEEDAEAISAWRAGIVETYEKTYPETFAQINGIDTSTQLSSIPAVLDVAALQLQFKFIALNDNPFGKKHTLIDPDDGTLYAEAHAIHHPQMMQLLDKLDVSDIYLINQQGRVVYSTQKNIDLGTSLEDGPFKDSGLGNAYKATKASDDYEHVALTDFTAYQPDFNRQFAFMASTIQDTSDDDANESLGVLVFKIPFTQINAIVSNEQQWENIGLGQTGEIMLVGNDNKLRSMSRQLHQGAESFIARLTSHNIDADVINKIQHQQSPAGWLSIKSAASEAVLKGETGILTTTNYLGTEVLTAYAPLKVAGLSWGILSEINSEEAFHANKQLVQDIRTTAIIIAILMISIASILGWIFASTITRPIITLSKHVSEIESESDLTRHIEVKGECEVGQMAIAFNSMLEKFRVILDQVTHTTEQLKSASDNMTELTNETSNEVVEQSQEIDQISGAIQQMTASVNDISENANLAAEAANQATDQAKTGNDVVKNTIESINTLNQEFDQAKQVMQSLSQKSDSIGSVLDVIKNIAEQTNLLALNAAIEAARAGEQGRGFAVVADEVRTLASRTQDSTIEIEKMISELQVDSHAAVEVIDRGYTQMQDTVVQAMAAGDALGKIITSVDSINAMNNTIASAAEQQNVMTSQVNDNISHINSRTENSTQRAQQSSSHSSDVSDMTKGLKTLVNQFKT